jgi:SagB-type dehydrogenase family enzyme
MKKLTQVALIFALIVILGIVFFSLFKGITPSKRASSENALSEQQIVMEGNVMRLPAPQASGGMSLTEAMSKRRSVRRFSENPLSVRDLSQLLWSAQGITNERGFRTAPSAGATFPLEMFVMVNNVSGLEKGLYHYHPADHTLELVSSDDHSSALRRASLGQAMITDAGAVLIFGALFERTTRRYQERGIRYVHNEVGHASQNVHLQAAALDLGTVVIGAYVDADVEAVLNLDEEIRILYMMPVGTLD